MAISIKLRFEVLKRDSFTCQYCGRKAPDVKLEVDHIHPRAKNGGDELCNLLTACSDCNRGKDDSVLASHSKLDKQYAHLASQKKKQKMLMKIIRMPDDIHCLAKFGAYRQKITLEKHMANLVLEYEKRNQPTNAKGGK